MKTYPLMAHIRAAADATRIDVYDDIGDGGMFGEGISAKDFAAQLATVKGPLDVHINSYGGSVKDGVAITSAIRAHSAPTRTIVDGMACSAASVIMQAGDDRIVQPGAMVMIHDASSVVGGNPAEVRKAADELEKFSDNIAKVYADRAGGTPEQWRSAMRDETWYTADEAVDAGLADKVGDGAAAMPGELDLSAFAAIPDRIMARLREMPLRQPSAGYQPLPYSQEDWESTLCPVCGKYSDQDAKYCGQCGVMLAGRDDVVSPNTGADDGDGTDSEADTATNAAGRQVANAALEYLRRQTAQHTAATAHGPFTGTHTHPHSAMGQQGSDESHEHEHSHDGDADHGHAHPAARADLDVQALLAAAMDPADVIAAVFAAADVDRSDWDGSKAMSLAAKSDDPAATYKQICAGTKAGDPAKQDSWALPYKYPGKGPNADGVRNALSRLPQTDDLTNKAAAQALLERLMKQINPDYDPDAGNRAPSWVTNEAAAVPAWFDQTTPAAPAWLNPA